MSFKERRTSIFTQVFSSSFASAMSYPLIRMQSLMQTQIGYHSLNPELKIQGLLKNIRSSINYNFSGLFRGLSFYLSYQVLKGGIFFSYVKLMGSNVRFDDYSGLTFLYSSIGVFLASAAAYPFELNQNKSASAANSTNPNFVLSYGETMRNFFAPSYWTGYPLIYLRYMALNVAMFCQAKGMGNILPLSIGLVSIPIDVIRRNYMMMQWESKLPYKTIGECTKYLIQTHGYKSLFRGFLLYPEIYAICIMGCFGQVMKKTNNSL